MTRIQSFDGKAWAMILGGKDGTELCEILGFEPDSVRGDIHIDIPTDEVATATVSHFLTPDQIEQIAALAARHQPRKRNDE